VVHGLGFSEQEALTEVVPQSVTTARSASVSIPSTMISAPVSRPNAANPRKTRIFDGDASMWR
jgi:hypothetical protein